ncbi:MAG: hypothetical protein ACLGHQ_07585, partial [Acidimicrobiia bacterium]
VVGDVVTTGSVVVAVGSVVEFAVVLVVLDVTGLVVGVVLVVLDVTRVVVGPVEVSASEHAAASTSNPTVSRRVHLTVAS